MDPLLGNKVFASVLIGALLIMVARTLGDGLFGVAHTHGDGQLAYAIDLPEPAAGAVEAVVEDLPSLGELLVAASLSKGERQFGKCTACHSIEQGGANKVGPNLYNIVGGPVAAKDYGYSSALAGVGGNWTYEKLDAWLTNPKGFAAGNKMSFAGIGKPQQRADLIAYMRQYADNPPPLPAVEEAGDATTEAAEGAVEDAAEATDAASAQTGE